MRLGKGFCSASLEEGADLPVQIGKMIITPRELSTRTGERVGHDGVAEYYKPMKSKLDSETTPEQKFERFKGALRSVAHVSKNDLESRLAAERRANQGKPKRGPKPKSLASDHVSGDRD